MTLLSPRLKVGLLQKVSESRPYKEITHENCVIRMFSPDVEFEDLKWHRDREDRWVYPLNDNDWSYQEDNKLPIPLNQKIFIKEGIWHRVIKGTTDLKVLIEKKPSQELGFFIEYNI